MEVPDGVRDIADKVSGDIGAGIDRSAVKVIHLQNKRAIQHHRPDRIQCYIATVVDNAAVRIIDVFG